MALVEETSTSNSEDNRRGNLRVSCNVPVSCESSGDQFDGALKDVSPRGMRLELGRRLNRGDRVTIRRPSVELQAVVAVVRWCRRHAHRPILLAGLEFQMSDQEVAQSWAQPILSTFEFLQPLAIELIPAPTPLEIGEIVPEVTEPAARSEPEILEIEPVTPIPTPALDPRFVPDHGDLAVPDVLHVEMEPDMSEQEWEKLLADAQERLNHQPQRLLNKLLKGFREFAFEDRASVEERRRCLRLTCHYEVEGTGLGPVTIMDLSPAGLACLSAKKLARGTNLTVAPPARFSNSQPINSFVRYCRPYRDRFRIGLEFKGSLVPTWVSPALKEIGLRPYHLEQKRRYVRAQTALPIEVRDWRGEFEVATLLDLSRGGTLLRTTKNWEVGETLRLILGPIGYLPTLYLSGLVLHQRPDPQGWLVNINFIDAAGTNLTRLDLYIKTILARSTV